MKEDWTNTREGENVKKQCFLELGYTQGCSSRCTPALLYNIFLVVIKLFVILSLLNHFLNYNVFF